MLRNLLSILPVMNPHNVIPDLTYPVKVLIRDYLPEFFQRRVIVMPGKASSIVDQDDVPCHRVGQNAIKFPPDRRVLSPSPCDTSGVVSV